MKKNIILSIFLFAVIIILAFLINWGERGRKRDFYSSKKYQSKQLVKKNNFQDKTRPHRFGNKNRDRQLKSRYETVGRSKSTAPIKRGERINRSSGSFIGYFLYAVWLSLILVFILSRKKIKRFRLPLLFLAVLLFGILLRANPSPMQSVVKLFKMFNGMERDIIIIIISFIFFSLFSVLGSKLVCGWACPLGALQELIFSIPVDKKKFGYKPPFALSLFIRIVLFVLFFILLFGIGLGISNYVLFHDVNYFNIFDFKRLTLFGILTLPIFLVSSLYIFRPFCQFICPYGLYSWVLENFAVYKIVIIEDKCTKCQQCVQSCPTEAMKAIYEKKRKYFLPDCWTCGECIEACPTKAVKYENVKKFTLHNS